MLTIETTITEIAAELNVRNELCQEIMRRIWLKSCGPAPLPDGFVFNTGEEVLAEYPRHMGDRIEYFNPPCAIKDKATLLEYIKQTSWNVWNMFPYLGPDAIPIVPPVVEPPVPLVPIEKPEEPEVEPEPEEPPVVEVTDEPKE